MAEQRIRGRQVQTSGRGFSLPQLPASRSPYIFGSPEGQGLQSLGRSLTGIAQQMQQAEAREEAKAVRIATNEMQADLAVDFRSLAQQHYNNPTEFERLASTTLKGYVDELKTQDPVAGSALEAYGTRQIQGQIPKLAARAQRDRGDRYLAAHERLFTTSLTQIEDLATELAGLPEEAGFLGRLRSWEAIEDLQRGLLGSLSDADPVTGQPYFSEQFQQKEAQRVSSAIAKALARGMGQAQGYRGLAESFERGDLTMQLGNDVVDIRAMLTEPERKAFQTELAARANSNTSAARALVGSAASILKEGYPLSASMEEQVMGAVNEFPELAPALAQAGRVGQLVATLKTSSPVQVQATLDQAETQIRTEGATPESMEALDAVRTVDAMMKTQLPKDELAFGSSAGLYPLEPLDVLRPEAVMKRVDAATVATEAYGLQAVPFTQEELDTMTHQWADAPAEQRVATLQTLTGMNMPPAMFQRTLEKLGQKTPVMAYTASLVQQREPGIATKILSGLDILKHNPKFAPPKVDAVLPEPVHRALAMDVNGTMTNALRTATLGLYMNRVREVAIEGEAADHRDFDPDLWESAVEEAVGPIYQGEDVGRYGILLPRGMTAEDFEKVLYEDILTFGVASGRQPAILSGMPTTLDPREETGVRPYTWEEFKLLDWVTVGPGQYALTSTIGSELFMVPDELGHPITVDLRTSLPAVE